MFSKRFAFSLLLIAGAFGAGWLIGIYSHARELWPVAELRGLARIAAQKMGAPAGADYYGRLMRWEGKVEVSCPAQDARTMVLLIAGQSQTGNHAGQRHASAHGERVLNYLDGRCFLAASPLLGATGLWGESWTLLGNKLVEAGQADRVILVLASVSGTPLSRWSEGGDLNRVLLEAARQAQSRYRITHMLWHQGEADYEEGTPREDYARMFLGLVGSLRRAGLDAPVFVSVASTCEPGWRPDNSVAEAQRALPDPAKGIFPGVDTDRLVGAIDRYDGCHFGASGQEKFAEAWMKALAAPR